MRSEPLVMPLDAVSRALISLLANGTFRSAMVPWMCDTETAVPYKAYILPSQGLRRSGKSLPESAWPPEAVPR